MAFLLDNSDPLYVDHTLSRDVANDQKRLDGTEVQAIKNAVHALRNRARGTVNASEYLPSGYAAGTTDASEYIQAAFADGIAKNATVVLPSGTHKAKGLVVHPYLHVKGAGRDRTTLVSPDGSTVLTGATGSVYNESIVIEGLTIAGQGPGVGSGHGIYFPDNGEFLGLFRSTLRDLYIKDFGGHAVYLPNSWNIRLESIAGNNTGDHVFDIEGGNTTVLDKLYAMTVASGKCGYRIHGGTPVLIACNGINNAHTWGIFGDNVAEDGRAAYCSPSFHGCNVEYFGEVGLRFKAGSAGTYYGTTFISAPSVSAKALLYDGPSETVFGTLDRSSSFQLGAGASWANGLPIHSLVADAPVFVIGGQPLSLTPAYHYDTGGYSLDLPYLSTRGMGFQGYGGVRGPTITSSNGPPSGSGFEGSIHLRGSNTTFGGIYYRLNGAWSPTTTYGTAAPATGTWGAGDRCVNSAPAVGQPKGWVCTVAGTPGTWVSEGNL